MYGCGGWICTSDLWLMRPMRYYFSTPQWVIGATGWTRTNDQSLIKNLLYQLSYSSIFIKLVFPDRFELSLLRPKRSVLAVEH